MLVFMFMFSYLPWLTSIWKHIFSPSKVKLEDAAQNWNKPKLFCVCLCVRVWVCEDESVQACTHIFGGVVSAHRKQRICLHVPLHQQICWAFTLRWWTTTRLNRCQLHVQASQQSAGTREPYTDGGPAQYWWIQKNQCDSCYKKERNLISYTRQLLYKYTTLHLVKDLCWFAKKKA